MPSCLWLPLLGESQGSFQPPSEAAARGEVGASWVCGNTVNGGAGRKKARTLDREVPMLLVGRGLRDGLGWGPVTAVMRIGYIGINKSM